MIRTLLFIIFIFISVDCFSVTELLKTVKPSGDGGDYSVLETCLNDNEQDLVSADKYLKVEISGDWTSAPDTTNVLIHNYTEDATRHIIIEALGDARHDGTATGKATAYILQGSADTTGAISSSSVVFYTEIKGFIIDANSLAKRALNGATGDYGLIEDMIIHNNTGSTLAIHMSNDLNSTIRNCFIYDVYRAVDANNNTGIRAENVTAYGRGSSFGIMRIIAVNCYSANFSSEDFFSLTTGSDYNVSSDTSASDEATNYVDSQSTYASYFTSVTGGSEDLHLLNDSNSLWGLAGSDLSGSFTTDIDGTTRSAWDIGGDEYESGSPPASRRLILCS